MEKEINLRLRIWRYLRSVVVSALAIFVLGVIWQFFKFAFLHWDWPFGIPSPRTTGIPLLLKTTKPTIYLIVSLFSFAISTLYYWFKITTPEQTNFGFFSIASIITLAIGLFSILLLSIYL